MNSNNENSEIVLLASNLNKSFGNFIANNNINFKIQKGEIHALLGENGAGKSTFVKMIYGLLKPDSGTISWKENIVDIIGPKHARSLGIGMVFQHFSLFDALTVVENISLALPFHESLNSLSQRVIDMSTEYGLEIDPHARIYNLSVGEQQRVEIMRCLLQSPDLLIMDEPTSVLTPQEIKQLFSVLKKLSSKGCAILFITHKLEEVRYLTTKATVLRRGENVGTVNTIDHTAKSLAKMMVGHDVVEINKKSKSIKSDISFSIKSLSRNAETQFSTSLKDINIDIKGGEILGIAGIAGNGQHELMETFIGEYIPKDKKTIFLNGNNITSFNPSKRRLAKMAFVPEERIGHATVPSMKLSENFLLTDYIDKNSNSYGFIKPSFSKKKSNEIINNFDVRIPHKDPLSSSLSGGNLQKFIVGREISRLPDLLIASQPTWGVDVGAAIDIRTHLIGLAEMGSAVIVISQDLEEILLISDKISVIHAGFLSKPYSKNNINIEEIGLLMSGIAIEKNI